MSSFSVVIPAYNEERGIADIVNRVLAIKDDLSRIGLEEFELVVVDDGSRDRTAEIVRQMALDTEGLRLITHTKNKGYGGALKTGFSSARGSLIGFLDADGTYPPEYFPRLCQEALNGMDLVVGSRMTGTESKMPITRRVGNVFFAGLLSILGWQRVTDSASGMRVFRKTILEHMYPLPNGLNLTPVMSTRAIHEGIKMIEVPIPYSERVGRSKLSVVHDGILFLKSMLWTALAYNPVQILGLTGLAAMLVTLLIILGFVGVRLSGVTSIGPWGVILLFTALVSAVTGVSIFSIGVASNYLVSIFFKRPIRQGLFGKPLFKQPIEQKFGWIGLVVVALGFGIGVACAVLGVSGWEVTRLWFYMLGSAALILVGVQLITFWALIQLLAQLSQREVMTQQDLGSTPSGLEPQMAGNQ